VDLIKKTDKRFSASHVKRTYHLSVRYFGGWPWNIFCFLIIHSSQGHRALRYITPECFG
jgi:hypothetical protein